MARSPARIDVFSAVKDSRAEVRKRRFAEIIKGIKEVKLFDSYLIDARLSAKQLEIAAGVLVNTTFEKYLIDGAKAPFAFTYAIEIGFLPGVTDNVAATAKEAIADKLKRKFREGESVYSSRVFFIESARAASGTDSMKPRQRRGGSLQRSISGSLDEEGVKKIADTLYNPLIERATVYSYQQFLKSRKAKPAVPKVHLTSGATAEVNLWISDDELIKLSRERTWSLDLDSLKAIRNYFHKLGRNPTDIEMESLAQTWSEHCKHTIFANPLDDVTEGIYRRYIKGATNKIRKQKAEKDFCISVFKDNSGAISFDDEYAITHKVETHNTPSMLDPFGGAITGILGVNRDTLGFGLGAKPVLNYYGFCFADPTDKTELYRDQNKTQKVLSARRIMQGVISGVNSGGNCSGIATPQGFVNFNPRFRAKPLVFVGTVGLIPKKLGNRSLTEKRARKGDYAVMIGGRVGLDGIHGATFSSVALDSGSPATAVQIGDPITQKKLSDAVAKEARDQNLYNSITDNGAGGLSCSVAEMAKESGGFEIELACVPLKYHGLSPWQIWISESQERMTLAVPPKKWPRFAKLMRSRGVEATHIGVFTNSGKAIVKNKGKVILDIDLEFLHEGLPYKYQISSKPLVAAANTADKTDKTDKTDLNKILLELLARPGIASTAFISSQYDHEVQGVSVTKPLQGKGRVNADATVSRPLLTSQKGVVMSQGLHPNWSEVDAYKMAGTAIDTAIRNAVAAGADPDYLAILDNFCWSSSDEPERLYQLKEAARACYDYAVSYGTPFISGKDSMFNDFKGFSAKGGSAPARGGQAGGDVEPIKISVPPTLLISALGVIPDITKSLTLDFKSSGDILYIVGETHDEGALPVALPIPTVNAKKNLKLYRAFYQAVQKDLITSAIGVGTGGLLVSLAKTAIAGGLGVNVSVDAISRQNISPEARLLSETQGRLLVSVDPKKAAEFEKIMAGNFVAKLGIVAEEPKIIVTNNQTTIINAKVADAHKAYHETFKKY